MPLNQGMKLIFGYDQRNTNTGRKHRSGDPDYRGQKFPQVAAPTK